MQGSVVTDAGLRRTLEGVVIKAVALNGEQIHNPRAADAVFTTEHCTRALVQVV